MYYEESSKLIKAHPLDKNAFKILDRELAHAYAPDRHGYTELPLLCHSTRLSKTVAENLIGYYESAGVVSRYVKVSCPCGLEYDPNEGSCVDCGLPVTDASPDEETCYRIVMQPSSPVYDRVAQPTAPKVFISYRHADCSILASDIYYSLLTDGHLVFLDNGSIAVGADSEKVYLNAASKADYFIALISENYFQSDFCKKEIAHAARCGGRLVRVNVPPFPAAPNDMPWIDSPNWSKQQGQPNGLDCTLEEALLSVVQIKPSADTIADLRKEACQFLMEQLSFGELDRLWNRLPWMSDFRPGDSKPQNIGKILQEVTSQKLPILCNALAL